MNTAALVITALAAVLFVARMLRGPALADRVISVDGFVSTIVVGVTIASARPDSGIVESTVLVVALAASSARPCWPGSSNGAGADVGSVLDVVGGDLPDRRSAFRAARRHRRPQVPRPVLAHARCGEEPDARTHPGGDRRRVHHPHLRSGGDRVPRGGAAVAHVSGRHAPGRSGGAPACRGPPGRGRRIEPGTTLRPTESRGSGRSARTGGLAGGSEPLVQPVASSSGSASRTSRRCRCTDLVPTATPAAVSPNRPARPRTFQMFIDKYRTAPWLPR